MKTHFEDKTSYHDWFIAWCRIRSMPDLTTMYCWTSAWPLEAGDRLELEHIWYGAKEIWFQHPVVGRISIGEGNPLLAYIKLSRYPLAC